VLGIGINVTQTAQELPVPTATPIALGGASPARDDVLLAVLEELPGVLELWTQSPDELRSAYTEQCDTLGEVVAVSLPNAEELTGRAVGIDEQGRLDIETDSGHVAVGAGDVVHVR
jgi:BirA family biotin operon repressor/biotin-[acetyl-CoA-carboxylase] ligase